ncbi:unnamed protein product [Brassica oleracea var. botrytis]
MYGRKRRPHLNVILKKKVTLTFTTIQKVSVIVLSEGKCLKRNK